MGLRAPEQPLPSWRIAAPPATEEALQIQGRQTLLGLCWSLLCNLFAAKAERGHGAASALDHRGISVLLATSVAFLGLAAPVALRGWLRGRRPTFEYGPIDIELMTQKAAQDLCGKKATTAERATSLIPDSLQDLEETAEELAANAMKPQDEVDHRAKALAAVGAPPFRRFLKEHADISTFERKPCKTLQMNIGLYCNQACTHCHVESSPLRKEMMSDAVVDRCLYLLRASPSVTILDITGGAPEMNSGFRRLVEGAAALRDQGRPELRIIDRCNLTVLLEPGQEELADFLAKNNVDIIASLPSYEPAQTDKQRGRRVFERSMQGLKLLNDHGYGNGGPSAKPGRRLDLVFNPPGAFLPPKQDLLDKKFRDNLCKNMGVNFNQLITIANMPVKRFFDFLRKKGTLEGYMDLLVRNFNPETVPYVMCLDHVNVGWDGRIFDCDFNQQLELGIGPGGGLDVFAMESLDDARLRNAPIRTAAHCFGCTAAQGST